MRPALSLAPAALLLAVATGACSFNPDTDLPQPPRTSEILQVTDELVRQAAQRAYDAAKATGKQRLEAGPCLADRLLPDWSMDVAHDPRTAADDLPENQCPAFLAGETHHLIELTPEGKLIRMR